MKTNRKIILWCAVLSLSVFCSCKNKETTTPTRKNIQDAVFASGHIEQENQFTVSASADGILNTIAVSEGDIITRNRLVAVIKSDVQNNQLEDAQVVYNEAVNDASANASQLQQIQLNINQARKQLDLDRKNYLRYKDLYATKSVAQIDFEKATLQYNASKNNLATLQQNYKGVKSDLELNEKRSLVQVNTQKSKLSDYRLTSPIGGNVISIYKKQGELIRRGEAIAEIGSGAFIIKLFVAEDDIKKVNLGQTVAVNMNTYPDQSFGAKVTKIYPAFDKIEQSYVVEAQFDKLPEKIFSGSQLQANIATGGSKSVLMIPTDYIIRESYVLLDNREEKKVKVGRRNLDWTEVIRGLNEGSVIEKPKK
jgi:multidrug efflux pump subunit AcrA (membrane-fusion protein)